MLSKPCLDCGDDAEHGSSRCAQCRRPRDRSHEPSASQRGYDSRYRIVRSRALRMQPWCTDCDSDQNLTVDHSARSWELIKQGQRPSLDWFTAGLLTVCCMACNQRRGAARGANVTRQD